MTDSEKVVLVKALVENDTRATTELVTIYLDLARDAVLGKMYPFGKPDTVVSVPTRYEHIQCRLASRYFLRMGAEGEITHSENGITRSYASADEDDLLKKVLPVVKVVS